MFPRICRFYTIHTYNAPSEPQIRDETCLRTSDPRVFTLGHQRRATILAAAASAYSLSRRGAALNPIYIEWKNVGGREQKEVYVGRGEASARSVRPALYIQRRTLEKQSAKLHSDGV